MAMKPCARCGNQFDEREMIFDTYGMLCLECEAAVASDVQMGKGVLWGILGPPLTALVGTVLLCIPVIGIFLTVILGLAAIAQAISSLRMAIRATEFNIDTVSQVLLYISSIIAILWGLTDIGIAGLGLLGLVLG